MLRECSDGRLGPQLGHLDATTEARLDRDHQSCRRERIDPQLEERRLRIQPGWIHLELLAYPGEQELVDRRRRVGAGRRVGSIGAPASDHLQRAVEERRATCATL